MTGYIGSGSQNAFSALLSTSSPSAAANVDLTSLDYTTYNRFQVIWDLTGSAGADLRIQLGGSAAASYNYLQVVGTTWQHVTGQTSGYLGGLANGTNNVGNVVLNAVSSGSESVDVVGVTSAWDGANLFSTITNQFRGALNVNEIKIYPSAGTITGKVYLYGLKT